MQNTLTYKVARGLGWFSVALGTVEVIAPGAINRLVGAREGHAFIRAFGFREIAAGGGILALSNPTPWLWARVAGDAIDLAALVLAWDSRNPRRGNTTAAIFAVAGVTALDFLCARALGAQVEERQRPRRDYSDRAGLAGTAETMRASAASGFKTVSQGTNVRNKNVAKITR